MSKVTLSGEKSFIRSLLSNLFALAMGLIVALVIGEIITRIFMPIFPGTFKLDKEGERLEISDVEPGAVYRQFSEEFDAITTITKDGYRAPEAKGNPDIVFIGDSFTYGQGLKDEDTFVMQYCSKVNLSCMNLGVPGLGTIEEVERLEKYLKESNVRPKKVYLVMLAMTGFLSAGNDLSDNLLSAKRRQDVLDNKREKIQPQGGIRDIANSAFKYSNLARVVKFNFFPVIKKLIVVEPEEDQLEKALKLTKEQLIKLDELSKQYQFEYQTILIHPVQDISRGTYRDTFKQIQSISPAPIVSSAEWLEKNPEQYYFAMDGHFNKAGSDKMVELLLSLDEVHR